MQHLPARLLARRNASPFVPSPIYRFVRTLSVSAVPLTPSTATVAATATATTIPKKKQELAAVTALSRAHRLADDILNKERSKVQVRIDTLSEQLKDAKAKNNTESDASSADSKEPNIVALELALRQNKVELGLSIDQNHRIFSSAKVGKLPKSLDEDVFASMTQRRWNRYTRPKLLKSAIQWGLMKDIFPEDFVPTVSLNVNFPNSKWLAPYGQHIDATKSLNAPEIVITRDPNTIKTEYYTLIMTDLDRPNMESKSYEEWCHWLVTDIPVGRRLEIRGGRSPFFNSGKLSHFDASSPMESISKTTQRIARKAARVSIPGTVVFDYVPPHPTFSNPRRADIDRCAMSKLSETEPLSNQFIENDGEKALSVRERFLVAPTMKLAKDYGLTLAGFGFTTSGWNPETSHVFTGLGIHEPVYGKMYASHPKTLASRLNASTEMVSTMTTPIHQLPRTELAKLNAGKRPSFNPNRVVTTGDIQLAKIHKIEAERITTGNEKTSQKAKDTVSQIAPLRKTQRLTELAAAALVRNKASDIASKLRGPITASILNRRNRYENR
ncbi:hypothetical protein BSLG_002430 [Batrachochytrium salamandrivorans]|nr:hypothetical protein BSLG_002430 [Batrachochytrium salamandrivorans]